MWIKPVAIMIDETEYWCEDIQKRAKGKIYGLYIYDSNVVTHMCSFEGSYWLIHLGYEIVGSERLSNEERDSLDSDMMGYAEDDYINERDADKHPHEKLPSRQCKKEDYEECWEDIVEYYRGNPPYVRVEGD